ncbi:hypothetical protein [Corynebacterium sp. HS2168-gen11]|uniref:hypothetical protein n=1 Tax=Corynebacterium sp. HS2168-gen11 TaxID=2974027 RepID=UPI00216AD578|nr:hypothetical protein [Corynebacterium sp. HS2168-gen11]MCS4535690.1 hypothetical protein [Corynebacterium sp. HS2168-gen11]
MRNRSLHHTHATYPRGHRKIVATGAVASVISMVTFMGFPVGTAAETQQSPTLDSPSLSTTAEHLAQHQSTQLLDTPAENNAAETTSTDESAAPELVGASVTNEPIVVEKDGATITIERNATSGGLLKLSGTGWKNADGMGSTLTIKLNYYQGDKLSQYRRGTAATGHVNDDNDVIVHPGNGIKDATIFWQFQAAADGSFETEQRLPFGLVAGQMLKLHIASGLVAGDTQRSFTTPSLVVDGVEYQEVQESKGQCSPSVSPPQARVAPRPNPDNTLRIEGFGFCNARGGGGKLAIKIDDGRVERLDSSVHDNRTVWAVVDADAEHGDFAIDLPLPNGTTTGKYGTVQPFQPGEHGIRILSGSLQEGDITLSLPRPKEKLSFVVGEYAPTGAPDPILIQDEVRDATRNGVEVQRVKDSLVVKVGQGKPGDWVYVSTYIADGSRRLPWGATWYQLDDKLQVHLLVTTTIPKGPLTFVVQNGNQGQRGEFLGWAPLTVADAASTSTPTTTNAPVSDVAALRQGIATLNTGLEKLLDFWQSTTPSLPVATHVDTTPVVTRKVIVRRKATQQPRISVSPARVQAAHVIDAQPQPNDVPKAPITHRDQLRADNAGEIQPQLVGEDLALGLKLETLGHWVYLHIFGQDGTPTDIGWAQLDATSTVHVDTSALPDGDYSISVSNPRGDLLGWVDLALGVAPQPATPPLIVAPTPSDDTPVIVTVQAPLLGVLDFWLLGSAVVIPLLALASIRQFIRKSSTHV